MQKNFFLSEIIASENVAINHVFKEENTYYRQSMGKQTVLRICISLRETFSTWIVFTGINKYGNGAVVQTSTVFRTVCYVTCRSVLWNILDIYLTTCLGVRNFKNTSAVRLMFCFKMYKIESKIRKWKKKKTEIVFFFLRWLLFKMLL